MKVMIYNQLCAHQVTVRVQIVQMDNVLHIINFNFLKINDKIINKFKITFINIIILYTEYILE
jgi:hypothetical protein